MVSLLLTLLVVLAIIAIAWWAIQALGLPEPVRIAAIVIVAVLAIVLLLQFVPIPGWHGGRLP